MKLLGVDLGKSGAIAELDTTTNSISVYDMPIDSDGRLDSHALFTRLIEFEPNAAVCEDVWRPVSLVRQAGALEAVCGILQCDCRRVAVVSWKRHYFGENTNDKQRSIRKCQELAPEVNLLKSSRSRVPSPDRAEAVLLAIFARDRLYAD